MRTSAIASFCGLAAALASPALAAFVPFAQARDSSNDCPIGFVMYPRAAPNQNTPYYLDTASSPDGSFAFTTDPNQAGLFQPEVCPNSTVTSGLQLTNGVSNLTWVGIDANWTLKVMAQEPSFGGADGGQTEIWALDPEGHYFDIQYVVAISYYGTVPEVSQLWPIASETSITMVNTNADGLKSQFTFLSPPIPPTPTPSSTTSSLPTTSATPTSATPTSATPTSATPTSASPTSSTPAPTPTVSAFTSCEGTVVCATGTTCTAVNNKDVRVIAGALPFIAHFNAEAAKFETYLKSVNASDPNLAVCLTPADANILQNAEKLVEFISRW